MTNIRQMLQQAGASGSIGDLLAAVGAAFNASAEAEAIAPVQAALRSHPDDSRLWHALGLLAHAVDDLQTSVEAYGKAAELRPGDPAIAHDHACVRLEAGLEASENFEEAMRLAPANRAIILRHAAALIAEGREAEAIAAIEQELERNPAWIPGHAALARVRWTAGDQDHFVDSFERALTGLPRSAELWRAYIEVFIRGELYGRALPVIARARAAAGANPSFDAAEATARSELGESEAAERLFRSLAQRDDPTLATHYLRFLVRSGRMTEAAAAGERQVAADHFSEAWPYLSLAWRSLGDPRWEMLEGDPSFVGVYDLAASLPPLDQLAERLRAIHSRTSQPLDQSVRGGTQTEGNLFLRVDPEIRALRQAVTEAVERHVAQLPPPMSGHPLLVSKRAPIAFAGSWSVRLTGSGRHIDHVHPQGWLSSALYISLPDEAERGAGEAGWLVLGQAAHLGVDLPPIRTIEPRPGRLVLFPSTMWHGTRPFEGGERLSVAFDVKRPPQR